MKNNTKTRLILSSIIRKAEFILDYPQEPICEDYLQNLVDSIGDLVKELHNDDCLLRKESCNQCENLRIRLGYHKAYELVCDNDNKNRCIKEVDNTSDNITPPLWCPFLKNTNTKNYTKKDSIIKAIYWKGTNIEEMKLFLGVDKLTVDGGTFTLKTSLGSKLINSQKIIIKLETDYLVMSPEDFFRDYKELTE